MPRDIVVIGASMGGVEALRTLISQLPAHLPAAVFLVLHIPPWRPTRLHEVLGRAGQMPAVLAQDGGAIQHGKIYVGPPDHHLLVENGRLRVVKGPKENRQRPAIDPLFRSAAIAYGPRVIGVLLTGNLDDGTAGLWQVKHTGGVTVIQDPADAPFPGMPANALANVEVDHSVPLAKMANLIVRLVKSPKPTPKKYPVLASMKVEQRIAKMEDDITDIRKIGRPSAYTCPECQGTLFEVRNGRFVRYRCRTGHAFSEATLVSEQSVAAEEALWSAMKALRERADLLKQRSEEHPRRSRQHRELRKLGELSARHAVEIRKLIEHNGWVAEDEI